MATSKKLFYSAGVALAATILATIYLATFWPGILSPDSLHQFVQAKSGNYDDWHPPLMAFLWSFLVFTTPPSVGYLIFQVTLLCLGLALVAGSPLLAGKKPIWLVLLAGICPPVWIYAGVLWKDVLLAALWLCCAGALLCAKYSLESSPDKKSVYRLMLILAAFFGVLGCMTRINAVPAFAPLAFMLPSSRSIKIRLASAALLIFGSIGASAILDQALTVKRSYPSGTLYLFDLGGITSFTGQNQFPGTWTEEENHKLLNNCYAPQGANNYLWGECKFVNESIQRNQLWGSKELRTAWLNSILTHPAAYLKHRLYHFYIFTQNPWGHRMNATVPNNLGLEFHPGEMFKIMTAFITAGEKYNLFYPAGWLLFGVGILILTLFMKASPTINIIQATILSALLYSASFLAGGVASDFRYSYWPILAASTSTLYLIHVSAAYIWDRKITAKTVSRL